MYKSNIVESIEHIEPTTLYWEVILVSVKLPIQTIKEIRQTTELGLKETYELVHAVKAGPPQKIDYKFHNWQADELVHRLTSLDVALAYSVSKIS